MAHELDTTNGIVSFANSRCDAWHQLGQSVGHAMTAAEALHAAHLAGWNVRKMPLVVPQPPILTEHGVTTPPPLAVPDRYATVRDNPIVPGRVDVLGVVGSHYEPVQNEQSCDILNALVDESGAHYETAGALRDGKETFVTMKLPQAMTLDGHTGPDVTEFYLAALNSHDGTASYRVIVTPVRIVCANTQAAALGAAKSSYSIRHTKGAKVAIAEARRALKLAWRYVEEFEAEAAALYKAEMDVEQMRRFARELVGADDPGASAATRSHRAQQAASMATLFTASPSGANVAGTRWGAYQAITEYLDHVVPVRGARTRSEATATRALRAITPGSGTETLKLKAFRMLQHA